MKEIFFLFALINFVVILLLVQKKKLRPLAFGLALLEIVLVYLGTVTP